MPQAARRSSPSFEVLGFPVHVRPGFVMFMLLIVLLNLDTPTFGLWLAGLMAVFTLLHELGHAIAARTFGCRAEIALDFLAGYAAYVPSRPLLRRERALISFAGPLVQIVAGLAVYIAVGGSWGWPSGSGSAAEVAALWAGPVIGVFNLIPVLPFDGGAIVMSAIDWFTPTHSKNIMYAVTLAAAVIGIGYMAVTPSLQPLIIFAVIPLLSVVQSMRDDRDVRAVRRRRDQIDAAEALAWATGRVDQFTTFAADSFSPAGVVPSPWFRAAQQRRAGHLDTARDILMTDLADRRATVEAWGQPHTAPLEELRLVADLLPRPLQPGRPYSTDALCRVLLRLGNAHEAGTLAAEAFNRTRSGEMAIMVARAASALDDLVTARAWIATAAQQMTAPALAAAVDASPELRRLANATDIGRLIN